MNWGLLEDNQKFKISIPIGKMSVKETEIFLREIKKMFPDIDIRMRERRLKLDKIMGKINGKEL
jgi:hypothetical protein